MPLIQIPQPWQLPERSITPESAFVNRRRFLKSLVGASIGASALALGGCRQPLSDDDIDADLRKTLGQPLRSQANLDFVEAEPPITPQVYASTYNNFYEFGSTKGIWPQAQKLPTDDWKVEVSGLVKNPRTYDLDDLRQQFPLEERVYRFRCVEAWAMVIPWIGFPMRLILEAAAPTPAAKFVRFTSFYDSQLTSGPAWPPSAYMPWPYTESLTVPEMANDLAFFAVGVYGRTLPKQHGAPIRMVVPWKYGFKGAKSVVKIEFVKEQPATFWHTLSPNEYGLVSNVNPEISHPRWSQKTERILGQGTNPFDWEKQETLLYNGYGEYVAELYA
ncbi:MAG: protein-methionine-sulfoxide reductase catalytic subunit MsrP [Leptolyngbyaceae cyanobacterium SL_1_1]|nr:protein-methionine-sulfoxide reductase catalytic subunit MsrP [Leptolyngbyaceae cyanobacterium RM1_1_2]NJO10740.1 protein-methionine-sulfoxide reductase catalytic subunit MsrP [Leptolyngbyaceae cyanobacterium SL_1_1]